MPERTPTWPPEAQLLLEACAPEPVRARLAAVAAAVCDWSAVWRLASLHRAAPLAAHALERTEASSLIPEAIRQRLLQAIAEARLNDRVQVLVLGQILDRLHAKGLQVMVLKGHAVSERLYPDPALRAPRDIDLLVRPNDRCGVEEVLRALGFAEAGLPWYERQHFHRPWLHPERTMGRLIELHWDVAPLGLSVQFCVNDWWPRARQVQLRAGAALAPSAIDELLHLPWHALQSGASSLRDLGDIARCWLSFPHAALGAELAARAEETGVAGFVAAALGLTRAFWPQALDGAPGFAAPPDAHSLRRRLGRVALAPDAILRRGEHIWQPIAEWAQCALHRGAAGGALRTVWRAIRKDAPLAEPRGPGAATWRGAKMAFGLALVFGLALTPAAGAVHWIGERRHPAGDAPPLQHAT